MLVGRPRIGGIGEVAGRVDGAGMPGVSDGMGVTVQRVIGVRRVLRPLRVVGG
jgi:hypothetical protein